MTASLFPALVSPRWRWITLIVILGMLFLVRLGFWQLDRLEWRRGLNAETQQMLDAPPLNLNREVPADLADMRNREVVVRGTYDFDEQLRVLSQTYNGRPGLYLLTPLRLAGTDTAVLVNRGWLPLAEEPNVRAFDEPGEVEVIGYLQPPQTLSGGRRTEISAEGTIYRIDVAAVDAVTPYSLLPMYVQAAPAEIESGPLYPLEPDLSLDEGSHLAYAIQWFLFAVMLGIIYLVLVSRSLKAVEVNGR